MKKGCEEIFGKGDYEIMLDGEGDSKTPVTFDTGGRELHYHRIKITADAL